MTGCKTYSRYPVELRDIDESYSVLSVTIPDWSWIDIPDMAP